MKKQKQGMAVIVKPTYACDAACSYCEVHKWGSLFKPMTKETFLQLNKKLEEHFETNDAKVTFYWLGGEPLMAGDEFFGEVKEISYNSSLQISHAIQSNLISFSKKEFTNLKSLLKEFAKSNSKTKDKKSYTISTSVDPVSDARVLKNGKDYNKAFLKSIFKLKKEGASYGAVYTVHSGSLGKEKEIYYYFKNLEFKAFNLNAMCDYSGRFQERDFGMTPKDYGKFMINLWDLWERDNYKIRIMPFTTWKTLRDTGSQKELRCFNDGVCNKNLCAVGPNGAVFACDRAMQAKQEPLGNIQKDSFEKMFEKKYHEKRISYIKNHDCKGCKWWDYCKGSCPYESREEFEGSFGKSFWCEGYKMLFEHINAKKEEVRNEKETVFATI